MDLRRISRSEIIAAVGGLLLALGVFLPWYAPNTDNPQRQRRTACATRSSAFDAHSILRWLLLPRRSRRSSCSTSSSATTSCRGRAAR